MKLAILGYISMKNFVLTLTLFMVFSCSKTTVPNLIARDRTASICVGVNASDLRRDFLGEVLDITINREGDEHPALKVVFDNKSSIILELENNSVWTIRIEDSKFTTSKGVGVGSTFLAVRKAYPDAILAYGEEDGGYISLSIMELNCFFSVDINDVFFRSSGDAPNFYEKYFSGLKAKIILIHNM